VNINDFIIRDYQSTDCEAIQNLWNLTGLGGKLRGDDRLVIEKTIQNGGKLIVLVYKMSNEIAGTSWLTTDNRRVYLHHFGIKPEFRGLGLSKLLLKESLSFAKATGMQIKLEVRRDNSAAVKLYTNYGFKYLGDYDVYIIRNYNELKIDLP
jgi:ribosomal protein S18 acetylase RimI-like enzyme